MATYTFTHLELNEGWIQPGNAGDTGGPNAAVKHGTFTRTPGSTTAPTVFVAKPAVPYDTGYFYIPVLPLLPEGFDLSTITAAVLTVSFRFLLLSDVNACQALEMEIQQNVANTIYNGGVDEQWIGNGKLNTFDYNDSQWVPTGYPCTAKDTDPHTISIVYIMDHAAKTMTHLALTMDGTFDPINAVRPGTPQVAAPYFNVGFQLDCNSAMAAYEVEVSDITIMLMETAA
jgi:hypothetical protein